MLYSMTGFARATRESNGIKCTIELRSVNHRFMDVNIKAPARDFELEKEIKDLISSRLNRGTIEVCLGFGDAQSGRKKLAVDRELVQQYLDAAKEISGNFPVYGEMDLLTLMSFKEILKYEEETPDLADQRGLVTDALGEALDALLDMRAREGEAMKEDILTRLAAIEEAAAQIDTIREKNRQGVADKVKDRIKEMFENIDVDENRLLTEAAILADRSDIAEEVTRLTSHITQVRELLEQDGPVGRKLDFLVQEMNREANTIGSKSNIYEISRDVVEIKSNLEKIREQAANIE